MRAVRRKTAEHLSAAWLDHPACHAARLADITGARGAAEAATRKQVEAAGGNLTVTAIA